jgi:glutamyl-tRNA synthetase
MTPADSSPSNGTDGPDAFRGRFAPSPTGDLHLGSAASALVNWLWARSTGGTLVLRVEDIDTPRVRAGSELRQLEDLQWLGLDWDEGPGRAGAAAPYRQSERHARYEHALAQLAGRGLTYYCDCSRADIARAASAPHPEDEGPRYPGTCRRQGMAERPWKRPPAVRLAVPAGVAAFDDMLQGRVVEDVSAAVGDFVLRRGDGVFAYQLAVVVDDLAMGMTHVARGADLLGSTARQILLFELLGHAAPHYAHHPMVLAPTGARLAKRAAGRSLRDDREEGIAPEAIVARIARALDLAPPEVVRAACAARDLVARFDYRCLAGRRAVELR